MFFFLTGVGATWAETTGVESLFWDWDAALEVDWASGTGVVDWVLDACGVIVVDVCGVVVVDWVFVDELSGEAK